MISPLKVAYMFLISFSAVMIGLTLTFLTGYIAGGFVGLWFVVIMFAGGQVMMVPNKQSSDDVQREFKKQLAGTRLPKRTRRDIL